MCVCCRACWQNNMCKSSVWSAHMHTGVQRLACRDRWLAMFLHRWLATTLVGIQIRDAEQVTLVYQTREKFHTTRIWEYKAAPIILISRVLSGKMTGCLLSNRILQHCASLLVSAPSHTVPSEGLLQRRSELVQSSGHVKRTVDQRTTTANIIWWLLMTMVMVKPMSVLLACA